MAIAALWPLAAAAEASPTLLAGLLLVDVVVVLGFTVAWYRLVDLRLEPRPKRSGATASEAMPAPQRGCVADALIDLAQWLAFGALAFVAGVLWSWHPAASVIVVTSIVAGIAWYVEHRSRPSPTAGSNAPGTPTADREPGS
ncbi:MAG: hypothetical protein KDB36_06445 [Acidimicrobiales bacterium]|nr:hypothetical protein [Acidimicrobiales bacterium]